MWLWILMACTSAPPADCGLAGTPGSEIGPATGDEFTPFTVEESVQIGIAPQGGYGLQARVKTTGLRTEANVSLALETWLDGALHASFTDANTHLFCNESDDTGRIWGVAFPLDPDASLDELSELSGSQVELRLQVTDTDGTEASTNAVVTLAVPD